MSRLRAISAVLVLIPSIRLAAQPPAAGFGETIQATAIAVIIDVRDADGRVPTDLGPADFVVLEDGVEMPVLSVEPTTAAGPSPGSAAPGAPGFVAAQPLAGGEQPWQVVVYVDSPTVSTPGLRAAARELAGRAAELAALGSVELVVADPDPERRLEPTRDPDRIAAAFAELAERGQGRNEIARLRREFVGASSRDNLDELTRSRGEPAAPAAGGGGTGPRGTVIDRTRRPSSDSSNPSGASGHQRLTLLRGAAQQEFQLLSRQRARMLDWMALVERPRRPHALVLVSDGFDLDPSEFYLSHLRDVSLISSAQSDLRSLRSAEEHEEMAKTIAAAGWQVVPVSLGQAGAQSAADAEMSGRDRFRSFGRGARTEAPGSGLSVFLLRAPLDPLHTMAEETGGELALNADQVAAAIASLSERHRLVYQVPRAPDGATHRLEVRTRRPGLVVRAPRSVSSATPDKVMAARARHVLAGERADGADLEVVATARTEKDPEAKGAIVLTLDYRADLAELVATRPDLDAADLRVTMAVELPDGRILVSQERPDPADLTANPRFAATVPLRLPKGTKRVAVALDDVESGAWGAAVVEPRL